jgi:hypothetical protein
MVEVVPQTKMELRQAQGLQPLGEGVSERKAPKAAAMT